MRAELLDDRVRTPKPIVIAPKRYTLRELFSQPALIVWCLYLILTPFYVVSSGLPQPGDALIIFLVPFALLRWDGKLDRESARTLRALFWFTAWVWVVNYTWAFVQWKWNLKDFLIHPLFYAYNAGVLFAAMIIAKREPARFLRLTFEVQLAMILFQVAASFVYRTDLLRGQLFFNSPNQLGYYALLSACLFAMTQRQLGLSRIWSGVGIASCAYLAVLSSSRASLAGILVLMVLLVFSNLRAVIVGSIVVVALTMIGGPVSDALEFSQQRAFDDRHPEISFAEERGYDRIIEYPEYLITGAGEGDYARFQNEGQVARELHSSFGSIVFGYGIVGVVLFMIFAVRVVRGGSLRASIMLIPPVAYTLAHQGLRFTMFWVLVAAFLALKQLESKQVAT